MKETQPPEEGMRPINNYLQFLHLEWLGNEIIGPFFDGLYRRLNAPITGNNHNNGTAIDSSHCIQKLHSIHFRHPEVGNDQLIAPLFKIDQTLPSAICRGVLIALFGQILHKIIGQDFIIIHHQNPCFFLTEKHYDTSAFSMQ